MRFELISGYSLTLTLVERNNEGKSIKRKEVRFDGGNTKPHFIPGDYVTNDDWEIERLEQHPWNVANGGRDFKASETPMKKQRVLEAERKQAKKEARKAKVASQTIEVNTEEASVQTEANAVKTTLVEEVKTVQEGVNYLLQNFPDKKFTHRDLKPKASLLEKALEVGVEFPNIA